MDVLELVELVVLIVTERVVKESVLVVEELNVEVL